MKTIQVEIPDSIHRQTERRWACRPSRPFLFDALRVLLSEVFSCIPQPDATALLLLSLASSTVRRFLGTPARHFGTFFSIHPHVTHPRRPSL